MGLTPILRREKTSQGIMVENGFIYKFSEDSLKLDRSSPWMREALKQIVYKNPN
jgi:hypothetical protein